MQDILAENGAETHGNIPHIHRQTDTDTLISTCIYNSELASYWNQVNDIVINIKQV